jgi:glucose/arabinose dehydrogenase
MAVPHKSTIIFGRYSNIKNTIERVTKGLFMALNSSKVVILILFVIFLAGCGESAPEKPITLAPTQSPLPSATLPITSFPTALPATETPFPKDTREAVSHETRTATTTPLPTNVAVIPDPAGYTWDVIAEGFTRPTGLATPPDGSGRLFVLEQEGLIYIIQDGQQFPVPFLDLRERASTRGSTVRGLLGMAFHPRYTKNGYFFVHYTQEGGDSVIARFQVSDNPNLANPKTEMRFFEINYPIGEHVGGALAFGPDGKLYFSIGDGGAAGYGDEPGNAQNPQNYLGSIVRVNIDIVEEPEVWAIGLRNPWRFSFDSLNGDLYIADVGENQWEEINYLPAGNSTGANFGWNFYEGNQPYHGTPPESLNPIFPVSVYDHSLGCSITGGHVYRGKALPEFFGVYIYGDYCTGNIWGLLQNPDGSWQNELLFELPAYITSFGQDETGEIYLVSITGVVYQLVSK